MNVRPGGASNRAVTRASLGVVATCVVVMAGCGSASPSAESPRPLGTEISVENHLAWPYTLRELSVALDGQLLHRTFVPSDSRELIARLDLPPGPHTLSFAATASFASGTFGHECDARMRGNKTFEVGSPSPTVDLILYAKDATYDFVDRVDARFVTRGVRPARGFVGLPAGPAVAEQCQHLVDPVKNAVCLAEVSVLAARRQQDLVAVLCYSDKLTAMQTFVRLIEQEGPNASAKADMARRRIAELRVELEQCVAQDVYTSWPGVETSTSADGCTGSELIDPDSVALGEIDDPTATGGPLLR